MPQKHEICFDFLFTLERRSRLESLHTAIGENNLMFLPKRGDLDAREG
jgi:hypothetical protein